MFLSSQNQSRRAGITALVLGLFLGSPAVLSAATITQSFDPAAQAVGTYGTVTSGAPGLGTAAQWVQAIAPFDTQLGTLTSVEVDIDVSILTFATLNAAPSITFPVAEAVYGHRVILALGSDPVFGFQQQIQTANCIGSNDLPSSCPVVEPFESFASLLEVTQVYSASEWAALVGASPVFTLEIATLGALRQGSLLGVRSVVAEIPSLLQVTYTYEPTITSETTIIPLPAGVVLLLSGLAALGLVRVRRRPRAA